MGRVWEGWRCESLLKCINKLDVKYPDSKVNGANMGLIWGRQDPGGSHVAPHELYYLGTTIVKLDIIFNLWSYLHNAGIILCMHPANGRQRYIATSSHIGWMHTQNYLCDWYIRLYN